MNFDIIYPITIIGTPLVICYYLMEIYGSQPEIVLIGFLLEMVMFAFAIAISYIVPVYGEAIKELRALWDSD